MTFLITSLPLPQATIRYLLAQNIRHLSDVLSTLPWIDTLGEVTISNEIKNLQLPQSHEKLLVDAITSHMKNPVFINGEDVREPDPSPNIITFCSELDALLGGGLRSGEIVEFLGEPGSGTTQLCLQLAVDCRIPRVFGGRHCKVLIIDCNGDTCVTRLRQMTEATLTHLNLIASSDKEKVEVAKLSVDEMLSNIHTVRCTDYSQLIAVINMLSEDNDSNYGAVIIDAFATHFRHEFEDMRQRTNVLAELTNKLHGLCIQHGMTLVTVNQVRMDGEGTLQPCLGESWSHTADRRVLLQRLSTALYSATIMKGERSGETVQFKISSRGLRDCTA